MCIISRYILYTCLVWLREWLVNKILKTGGQIHPLPPPKSKVKTFDWIEIIYTYDFSSENPFFLHTCATCYELPYQIKLPWTKLPCFEMLYKNYLNNCIIYWNFGLYIFQKCTFHRGNILTILAYCSFQFEGSFLVYFSFNSKTYWTYLNVPLYNG